MSDFKDTLFRYIATLQLIPREPQRIATPVLQEKLQERGFKVDLRSLQRDLKDKLSLHFPLICHDDEKPFRWSFDRSASLALQAMDTPRALALHLAEAQLVKVLPQTVTDYLRPEFDAARRHIDALQHNQLSDWSRRVRALPNGLALIPAAIDDAIWQPLCDALLNKQQLSVSYLSRTRGEVKRFVLNPNGLVSRSHSSYLIASVEGYDDLRHFALHRISQIALMSTPASQIDAFNIDAYIRDGGFTHYPTTEEVTLIADVHPQVAWLLEETPLSLQQSLTPLAGSDWRRLEAQVPMDAELLWWIYGQNQKIRLHAPAVWVEEIKASLQAMLQHYALPEA